MSQLKLAILGAGRIAQTMAKTVRQMDDVCLYAVAAREEARAKAFAEQYGVEHYYGSYEEMLQDDGVELVYIATPHSHHAQHAKLCIEHGRPVLCEKAFTWTAEEVYADVPDVEGDGRFRKDRNGNGGDRQSRLCPAA